MSKTFSQESSDAFHELYKFGISLNKKTHQLVLTDCFEKNFQEMT